MKLAGLAYLCVRSSDPEASARFAADIVGLQRGEELAGEADLRADARSRVLSFSAGRDTALALEARDDEALSALGARLAKAGVEARPATAEEARARRVRGALFIRDATGNAIEIVSGTEHSARRFFPARDAGIVGLGNVGLRSRDVAADLHLWRALGAEVVDYVGDIAYLALDEAHHRVALYPSRERGVLYVAFEVASLDDVMRGRYFLAERQVRLVQGPGRQPVSQQAFVLFRGPDDLIYGYVAGMAPRPPNSAPPRQFALSAESLCAWGSRAVDVAELSPGPGDAP